MIPIRIPDDEIPEGYARGVWAAGQPQYEPLPSLNGSDGEVLARWSLSFNERQAILDGANIELRIWTYGRPIDQAEYDYLSADRDWCRRHAPERLEADTPRDYFRVDLMPPIF